MNEQMEVGYTVAVSKRPPKYHQVSQFMKTTETILLLTILLSQAHWVSAQAPPLDQRLISESASDLAADAREKGDPKRGALHFFSPGLGCFKCHERSESNPVFGPSLIDSRQKDDRYLVESVLQPSNKIAPEFQNLLVLTSDGKSVAGLQKLRTAQTLTMQIGVLPTDLIEIPITEIEQEKKSDVSVMPAGQVNALRSRQDFLDLIAYLIAIRDGGEQVAQKLKPSPDALVLKVPSYEKNLDHQGIISQWDRKAFKRGSKIYEGLCVNCHGTIDRPGSLPTSLRFAEGKFKFGKDPFSMYQTLTHGGGLMVPQSWMVPQQKYDVIHYIREHFLKEKNPSQYASISKSYLQGLPKGDSKGPEPQVIEPWTTMDYGPMLTTTIEFGDKSNIAQKAIAIRLDDGPGGVARGNSWIAFEHDTLRMAAVWTKQFVDWNGIQFNGRHGVHLRANGTIQASNPTGPGWANPTTGSFKDDQRVIGRDNRRYGPLPSTWGKFHGLHRYENQVVLRYTVGKTEILERPSIVQPNGTDQFVRTLNLGARPFDLKMLVMTAGKDQDPQALVKRIQLIGFSDHAELALEGQRVVLRFAKSPQKLTGHVVFGGNAALPAEQTELAAELKRLGVELHELTKGGPAQMATPVDVQPESWFESDAWAVDELTRPDGNPWLARTRVTGLDFYPDTDAMAICTWDGDVWRVEGLQSLGTATGKLRWHRIASGLFQPLGILVAGDRLMVTCRDQLVSLGDSNGDGELDDYRCFNSDHQVTEHFHEFAMGLQRDDSGDFYYAKSARHALKAVVPHHGTLLRVAADGSKTEILATGFRAANGVCLNNDGSFIVTDQEGHWNPKNRINWVRHQGFYGNMYGYHDVTDDSDEAMEQPLCWITNEFDRSPAELLWVDSQRWGALNGQLLNLSYGYGRIYTVPHEHISTDVGTQPQGGMCQLPIPDLPTGMIRGRFSPQDGQLYVGGMFSWAGSRQEQEGGLFRVRHKQARVDMPVKLQAFQGGMDLSFSDPLHNESADPERFEVNVWNLKRTKNYGSKHFNERELEVGRVALSPDKKTVQLSIPNLEPTWGMEIVCRIKTTRGQEVRRVIHNTIHHLGER